MPHREPRKGPRAYADLHALSEETHVALTCKQAIHGDVVGLVVNNEPATIDRYCAKIKAKLPNATIERVGVLIKGEKGGYLIKVSIKNLN